MLRQPRGQDAEGGVGFAQRGVVCGQGGGLGLYHSGVAASGGAGECRLGAEGLQVSGGALHEAVAQSGYIFGGYACVLPQFAGGGVQHGQEVAGEHGGGVVEGFGCGNVPPAVKRGIELARRHDIPVVMATRVIAGRVAPVYSYEGSAGSLIPAGVILAGESSGQKARLKLMLALKAAENDTELRAYFKER